MDSSVIVPQSFGNWWKIGFLAMGILLAASIAYIGWQFSQKPTPLLLPTPTPVVQSSPTPDQTANWKVFHFASLNIDLKLPPNWIPTTTEFTPSYIGPDTYINRLNLPKPLTPEEEKTFQQNTISIQVLELDQTIRPTSYSRIINLKNNKRLFFGVMNPELSAILDQILSTFKFLQ